MPEQLPHSSASSLELHNEPVPKALQWIKDNSLPIIGVISARGVALFSSPLFLYRNRLGDYS
jgi:hypothetical protein